MDYVITWVNGRDPAWVAQKTAASGAPARATHSNVDSGTDDIRFQDADEIRFNLQCALQYAPYLRKIYIVASDLDSQTPRCLDDDARLRAAHASGRIEIVRHSAIIPAAYLPTFNSLCIEFYLHRIPGLSPFFLYGNDDFFFGRKHSMRFWQARGRWRLPVYPLIIRKNANLHQISVNNAKRLLIQRGIRPRYMVPHVTTLYARDCAEQLLADFAAELARVMPTQTFRNEQSISWSTLLVNMQAARKDLFATALPQSLCVMHYGDRTDDTKAIMFYGTLHCLRPVLFCINNIPPAQSALFNRQMESYLRRAGPVSYADATSAR